MAPKELNFITGNRNKLKEVQEILSVTPVKLESQSLDLPELQGTIEEISTDKCRRAAHIVRSSRNTNSESLDIGKGLTTSTGQGTGVGRGHMLMFQRF